MRIRALTIPHRFLAIIAAFMLSPAFGQNEQPGRGNDGEIEDLQIEIIKERQITLPPANRNFEKIPPRPAEQTPVTVDYEFRPLTFRRLRSHHG